MCGKQFLVSVIGMLMVSIFVIEIGQNYQFVDLPSYVYNVLCVLIGLIGLPAIGAALVSGGYWLVRRKPIKLVFTIAYWILFGIVAAGMILFSLRMVTDGLIG